MKVLHLNNEIGIESLLSSTTYGTELYDRCIYCHEYADGEQFEYDGSYYMPHRCECDKAKEELKAKETLLIELNRLQESIDTDKLNEITKEYLINRINRAYEMGNKYLLESILD
ncbi:hypothetical protein SDC9_169343 [bioreactor metagenome]|uniref:Uncharacterized protein n=1 Tax=bioreactor metagenome TaxID=1076179 RepID=A0A645G517_9ZZZZ